MTKIEYAELINMYTEDNFSETIKDFCTELKDMPDLWVLYVFDILRNINKNITLSHDQAYDILISVIRFLIKLKSGSFDGVESLVRIFIENKFKEENCKQR